jgi:hypothetical protein
MIGPPMILHGLPWPAAILGASMLAWTAGGVRLALFAAGALLYMLMIGY